MRSRYFKPAALVILIGIVLCAVSLAKQEKKSKRADRRAKAKAVNKAKGEEIERKVTEAEVPAAALKALKKLAGDAKITEFAEEIEYGHTFYEGSWKGRSGEDVDVLVTKAGDLVEIEEKIPTDKVPAAALKAARKLAGKKAQVSCEKKTMILYEVKFTKGQARHEVLLTPDGRVVEKEVEKGTAEDGDNGNGDDNDDDKSNTKANVDEDDDDEDDDDEDDDDEDDDDEDDDDDDEK